MPPPKTILKTALSGIIAGSLLWAFWHANQHSASAPLSSAIIADASRGLTAALLASLSLGIGALLIHMLPRYQWLAAAALLVVATPLALTGFWPNGHWGISDWDYYFSYHHIVRSLILDHGVFPHWNPYICGGTAAMGDPEFPLFAPTFLLELIFGIPAGFRLAIFSITAFGGIGMLLLGKRLGLKPLPALLAAIAFAFGSINLLEIIEGHPNVFSASYLPWLFWAWLAAYQAEDPPRRRRWSLAAGILLALMFFHGGIYMLMYTGIALLFLLSVLPRRRAAFLTSLSAGIWALGFAAVKLIPSLLWLRQFQDAAYASSTSLLSQLHLILLGRFPHGSEDILLNQGGGWHEYGAYLGPVILATAIIALIWQRRARVVWLLAGAAALALLVASSGPILKPLFDQAPWLPRSNISRIAILAVVPLSLLAGMGLNRVTSIRQRWLAAVLGALVLTLAAVDLFTFSQHLSRQAFIITPAPPITPAPAPLAHTIDQKVIRVGGIDYTRAYARTRAGYGTQSYCSVLGPSPSVRVLEDPEGSDFLTVANNTGEASLRSWSPNRIVVAANLPQPADLIINSNYAPAWTVSHDNMDPVPADEISGRLATSLPAGQHTVIFAYQAPGFIWGTVITTLTTVVALAYCFSTIKWAKSGHASRSAGTGSPPGRR